MTAGNQRTALRGKICLQAFESSRTAAEGLSFGPAKRNPVLVGFSFIFLNILLKFCCSIGGGANIELAFVDEKVRWIALRQNAFTQVISAEASILRNIS